jgi:Mrp family chromosome partitioning ATPase
VGGFLTLVAECESCSTTTEVYADQLFEFDCRCTCGGLLVLQEDEEEEGAAEVYADPPTKADGEELFLAEEALAPDVARSESETASFGDRPTKADTEDDDPYALAAQLLDPTSRYDRVVLAPDTDDEEDEQDEQDASDLEPAGSAGGGLEGTPPEQPPLPAWDGGDTQQVQELAHGIPRVTEDLGPLLIGDAPDQTVADAPQTTTPAGPEAASPPDDVVVVQLPQGSGGRGSRSYDADQVIGEASDASEVSEASELGESTLFGQDLDWLALIDDRLPEDGDAAGGDEAGRVVIRMPEGAEPTQEELREAIATLDGGGAASLGSLIVGGLSDSRQAQRFQETLAPERLPGDGTQPLAAQLGSDPMDAATQSFARPDEVGEVTRTWSEAEEDPPGQATVRWKNGEPDPGSKEGGAKPREPSSSSKQRASSATHNALPPSSSGVRRASRGSSGRTRRPSGSGSLRVIENLSKDSVDPALVCIREVGSPEADHFRQLYQQIFQARNGSSPRTVLVTSPNRGEGKTTIAANLAAAAARVPGRGVVLVDADPRGRGVLKALGEGSPMEGLLEALETGKDPADATVQFPKLGEMEVVPLGIRGSNAAELIASDHMGDFIRGLQTAFPDWSIIVDGSAALTSADPLVLAQHVDGVVLVVRAAQTADQEVSRVADLIGRRRLLGVVLNDARSTS